MRIPKGMEKYTSGTGPVVLVHIRKNCVGENCVIHNPSDHLMKDWPTHWRDDRQMMERMCPCGIGHPDPDDLAFKKVIADRNGWKDFDSGVHGCCGCCTGKKLS